MRRTLRITLLALTLLATGLASAEGNSVTCSASLPPYLNCFYERVGWSLFGLEGAFGVEATLDPRNAEVVAVAPYSILGYYAPDYAWWLEVRVPKLGNVPLIGTTDYLRAGFTVRW